MRTPRRRITALAAGIAALALSLSACSGTGGAPAGAAGAATAGEPVQGGHLVFADVATANQFQTQMGADYRQGMVLNSVLDRLTYFDGDSGEIVPWIATAWSNSDDFTEFTFTIRDGVTFSDGTPLDAEAVRLNLDALGLGIPESEIRPNKDFHGYRSAEVIGDDQVKVTLDEPNANFVRATSATYSGLVSPGTLELDNAGQNDISQIVASGPFVYESHTPDEEIVFTARTDYAWAPASAENQGAPYLDGFTIKYLPEVGHRAAAVQSGQVDLARGIQPTDELLLTSAGHNVYPAQAIDLTSNSLVARHENGLVADPQVRRALQLGTDRQGIKDVALSDSYEISTSILHHEDPNHVDLSEHLEYDPDAAREILDDAGWVEGADGIREKDGQKLELTVAASSNSVVMKPAIDVVEQQWREIGVQLVSRAGDNAFFAISQSDPDVPVHATRAYVYGGLGPLFGAPGSITLGDDEVLQELADAARAEVDPDARQEIIAKQQEHLVVDEAITILLWDDVQVFGGHSGTHIDFTTGTTPIFQGAWKAGG